MYFISLITLYKANCSCCSWLDVKCVIFEIFKIILNDKKLILLIVDKMELLGLSLELLGSSFIYILKIKSYWFLYFNNLKHTFFIE